MIEAEILDLSVSKNKSLKEIAEHMGERHKFSATSAASTRCPLYHNAKCGEHGSARIYRTRLPNPMKVKAEEWL